jgi:hypothetical protein
VKFLSHDDMQRFDSSRQRFWSHVDALLTPLDANRLPETTRLAWWRPIAPDSTGRVAWDVIGTVLCIDWGVVVPSLPSLGLTAAQ